MIFPVLEWHEREAGPGKAAPLFLGLRFSVVPCAHRKGWFFAALWDPDHKHPIWLEDDFPAIEAAMARCQRKADELVGRISEAVR